MTSGAMHALFNGNQQNNKTKKTALLRLAQKENPPIVECGKAEIIHLNFLLFL